MRGGKWIIAAVLFVSRVSALQYIGADISSVIQEERAGIVYKNQNGTIKPLEHILAENGFNMVRQRVWVTDGDHGIDYNLQLAQRVVKYEAQALTYRCDAKSEHSAGMKFGLNFHFSDTWTNPGLQGIPPGLAYYRYRRLGADNIQVHA